MHPADVEGFLTNALADTSNLSSSTSKTVAVLPLSNFVDSSYRPLYDLSLHP